MKKVNFLVLFFVTLLFISSCGSYQEFVSVQARKNITNGTQSIILTEKIERIKEVFKNNGIMIQSMEGGFKTEEVLLDEGTRAMYKVHQFDNQLRITAFWGITQKVKSRMTTWVGAAAASSYEIDTWDKVIYDNKAFRPKKVFDYVVQLIEKNNLKYRLK